MATYHEDIHSVEYLPGRYYVCNALDKFSCMEIAQSIAEEEGEAAEIGGPFDDDTGLKINIPLTYQTVNWGLIAAMCGAVLFMTALSRG